jgi:quinol monooxygenase YgiN
MPVGSFKVVARIKASPKQLAKSANCYAAWLNPQVKSPAVSAMNCFRTEKDPTDFTFMEEWETDAAFESHAASDHINAIGPKLQPVVADLPTSGRT